MSIQFFIVVTLLPLARCSSCVTSVDIMSSSSAIAKFYSGRSVFITGGLGFIGKQIVEKLLRSCPEVDNVYLLVRQKKGQSVEQRLKKTLQSPVRLIAVLFAKELALVLIYGLAEKNRTNFMTFALKYRSLL